mmetsp:Transcript_47055/g.121003  ORF Transcript_47055/g.121003 Transcript_47055/m.121003 type:complete len:262 (-) Transcript_47055:368-1153(-)
MLKVRVSSRARGAGSSTAAAPATEEALDAISDLGDSFRSGFAGVRDSVQDVPELLLGGDNENVVHLVKLRRFFVELRVVHDLLVTPHVVIGAFERFVKAPGLLDDLILLLVNARAEGSDDLVVEQPIDTNGLCNGIFFHALQTLGSLRATDDVDGVPHVDFHAADKQDEVLVLHVLNARHLRLERRESLIVLTREAFELVHHEGVFGPRPFLAQGILLRDVLLLVLHNGPPTVHIHNFRHLFPKIPRRGFLPCRPPQLCRS